MHNYNELTIEGLNALNAAGLLTERLTRIRAEMLAAQRAERDNLAEYEAAMMRLAAKIEDQKIPRVTAARTSAGLADPVAVLGYLKEIETTTAPDGAKVRLTSAGPIGWVERATFESFKSVVFAREAVRLRSAVLIIIEKPEENLANLVDLLDMAYKTAPAEIGSPRLRAQQALERFYDICNTSTDADMLAAVLEREPHRETLRARKIVARLVQLHDPRADVPEVPRRKMTDPLRAA